MAGILDQKTRILDTYITEEGRRQLADGKFQAKYYSFTDGYSIYNEDTIVSSSTGTKALDATYRICFEATSLPQDQVTFEADDSGKLINVKNSDLKVLAGQIFSGSVLVTGSQFTSTSEILLSSSLNSYKNLRILSSPNAFDINHNDFIIGNNDITFTITNDKPINSQDLQRISIDQVESLFMDKRLSHIPNFTFLPPVNKAQIGGSTTSLGTFQSLNQSAILSFEQLQNELNYYENNGFEADVYFTETTNENNIFCQFFEVSGDSVKKLDVIDFGIFNTPKNPNSTNKHVFFVGKLFIDNLGSTTFVNMFTLVFE